MNITDLAALVSASAAGMAAIIIALSRYARALRAAQVDTTAQMAQLTAGVVEVQRSMARIESAGEESRKLISRIDADLRLVQLRLDKLERAWEAESRLWQRHLAREEEQQ